MFIHYKSGDVLPTNMGVLDMVFPYTQYYDHELNMSEKQVSKFLNHFDFVYEKKRNESNFSKNFSYPNHTPYYDMDYELYPHSKLIDSITIYKIYIKISPPSDLKVLGGDLIQTIKR